jgi:hypothetical protein
MLSCSHRGPFRGVEASRPLFEAMIAEFRKPGAAFGLSQMAVDGEHGYIVWTAETADNVSELGTDTFVVRDGAPHPSPSLHAALSARGAAPVQIGDQVTSPGSRR